MPNPPKNQESNGNQNQDQQIPAGEPTEQHTENTPAVTELTPSGPVAKTYTEADMQAVHQLYGSALQEKDAQVRTMQSSQQPQNQSRYTPEDDARTLLEDPRKLIREEIQTSIAPLIEGMQGFRAQSVYENLKNQFRNHPQYSHLFQNVPNFEQYLDQAMQGVTNITIPLMQQAIAQVVGVMVTSGQYNPMAPAPSIPNGQPRNQPAIPNNQPAPVNNNPTNMNLPAHLRPSGPPAPSGGNGNLTPKGNPRRVLTENERRVARERNLSDDDYIDWLYVPIDQVVKSDIGRPRK